RTRLYSAVDAGAAMSTLLIEAVARGLIAHPMAGFDGPAAVEAVQLADGLHPLVMIAVGRLGEEADVAPEIVERDKQPRHRLPLD
ncbi:nitroreductase, partial [Mycobacterium sp. ITM-2017-0098]